MNQSFDRQQLLKFFKQDEFVKHKLIYGQLCKNLDTNFEIIGNEEFNFDIKKVHEYYLTEDIVNKLILRKLNDNIKRIYKDEQANRRIIISQIRTLLEETCPFWIIKTDIKSFYESIDRNRIIAKFRDDSMLSYQSIYLLKKIFDNSTLSSAGIPRGMNISSTLSEIYMRKFDRWIRRFKGVYFYARFVDDIIVFSSSLQQSLILLRSLNSKINELAEGLIINEAKTQLFDGKTLQTLDKLTGVKNTKLITLEYLGYKFVKLNKSKENDLKITIADKKVKKIKTRIILALADYLKNKNFNLLEKRFKFLTGNFSIKKNTDGNDLRAGIHYNYLHVTDLSVFEELNSFYRKAIFSKNKSFGNKLTNALSQDQRYKLNKYCFKAGFKLKVYESFSYQEISEIIKCW